ncbi:DUF559 domain-containing protein [Microbacterium sp. GCS4]|uniref:DUF559 domain-containing protein n=1 Tax=Microbacterium sp. GCS4 TaxID=1692239 RepID=UPI000682CBC5|nr:DUF559 domain-containing protein [Microbacterium sp. GCS4]KNY07303.1 DNA/RNA helicase [Microbacterium sp. GCS4]
MRSRNGVAHSTALRNAGFTDATIRRAVASGHLVRVRRSWLIDPTCSQARRRAAAGGGRITCVTAALELGLWTPAMDSVHIAVPATASRNRGEDVTNHWARGPIPVPSRSAEEPLLNVLFHVARCLEPADALAVWESALHLQRITDVELARVRWRSARADSLAAVASSLSDSGLETRFVWLMREIGVTVRQQVWIDGHPLDGLIGDSLAVQIDGFAHHSAARDRRRDIRADARLVLRGYTTLRFDFHQLLFTPDEVQATVLTAIAQGLHRSRLR